MHITSTYHHAMRAAAAPGAMMRINHAYSSDVDGDQLVTARMIEDTTARSAAQHEPPYGGRTRRPAWLSSS